MPTGGEMPGGASRILTLEEPSPRHADSYRSLVTEFIENGEDLVPFPLSFPHSDFSAFLSRLAANSRGEGLPPGFVPHSTFWLVFEGTTVVGVSNLRHYLTESLRRDGGSIGYGIRPSARGLGYGGELLRQTIMRAAEMGMTEVLLTCDKANRRSASVIARNGGVLESEESLSDHGDVVQRYRISISTEG